MKFDCNVKFYIVIYQLGMYKFEKDPTEALS